MAYPDGYWFELVRSSSSTSLVEDAAGNNIWLRTSDGEPLEQEYRAGAWVPTNSDINEPDFVVSTGGRTSTADTRTYTNLRFRKTGEDWLPSSNGAPIQAIPWNGRSAVRYGPGYFPGYWAELVRSSSSSSIVESASGSRIWLRTSDGEPLAQEWLGVGSTPNVWFEDTGDQTEPDRLTFGLAAGNVKFRCRKTGEAYIPSVDGLQWSTSAAGNVIPWNGGTTYRFFSVPILPDADAPSITIDTVAAGLKGTTVQLSATPTGGTYDTLTYAWSVNGGSLNDATSATPTWTRPQVTSTTTYTISLTVTASGTGTNAVDTTSDTASATTSASVTIPDADAPSVSINAIPNGQEGTTATLQLAISGGTYDGTPTYAWTVTGGTLSSSTAASPTWTRPSVTSDTSITVSCTVTVRGTGTNAATSTSDTASATRSALVTDTPNAQPTASIQTSASIPVASGGIVNLMASDADSDGTITTRAWTATQADGTAVGSFADNTIQDAVWTAPVVARGEAQLAVTLTYMVTDNLGGTASASITINVDPIPTHEMAIGSSEPIMGMAIGGTKIAGLAIGNLKLWIPATAAPSPDETFTLTLDRAFSTTTYAVGPVTSPSVTSPSVTFIQSFTYNGANWELWQVIPYLDTGVSPTTVGDARVQFRNRDIDREAMMLADMPARVVLSSDDWMNSPWEFNRPTNTAKFGSPGGGNAARRSIDYEPVRTVGANPAADGLAAGQTFTIDIYF